MSSHLKLHSFTGSSDHDFTGLAPNQLLKLGNSGNSIESYGTASTVSFSSITNVDYIDFNISPTPIPTHQEGRIHWDDDTKTLEVDTSDPNVHIEIGHNNLVYVRNTMAFTVTAGTVVYMSGQSGNRPTIAIASNDSEDSSKSTLGLVSADISPSSNGYVTTYGLLRNVDTSIYSPGDQLYLGVNGAVTTTKPTAPNHEVRLGKVVTSANPGIVFVDIMNGYELNELHDVHYTTSALTQNNLLYWDTGNTRWQATDASNLNIATGTGTAGTIAKWSGPTTLTNSLLSETGTGVTVNGSVYIYGNVDVLGTATTFNTQTVQTADNNITMNLSGSHLTALNGGITVLSGRADNISSTWTINSSGAWSANTPGIFTGLRADSNGDTLTTYNSAGTNTFVIKDSGKTLLGSSTSNITDARLQLTPSTGEHAFSVYTTAADETNIAMGVFSTAISNWRLTIGKNGAIKQGGGANSSNWFNTSVYNTFGTVEQSTGHVNVYYPNQHGFISVVNNTDNNYAGLGIFSTAISNWRFKVQKDGYVAIGDALVPTEKLHISGGTIRIQTANSTEGAGKLAVSDANGSISFSSTTTLGLTKKYSTTLTSPSASTTNTITHNLGTTDISVTLWLVTTGDMTSARVTNRLTNSVDVIFSTAPGEDVRVVVIG